MKLTALTISVLISASAFANKDSIKVIYGEDNRKDVYETTNPAFLELAKSTAGMIPSTNLKQLSNGETEISGQTLASRGICAKERFSAQPSAANCSGFLVGSNLLVTAGHCVKNLSCGNYKWVFDYKVESADQAKYVVPSNNVYGCKKVLAHSLDRVSKDDFALIELDRKVEDRQPLTFRRAGQPAVGDKMVVIGHPSGLPVKIADGAAVRSKSSKYFVANLDTYGGNSGSAVFNETTGEVEGILVRGETDYVYNSSLGCQVSNVCPDTGCRGEDVTYITNISALMNIQ